MSRMKGMIFFWLSVIVFASANAVLAKLGLLGATNLIHGRNPISFCNVLFAANLIAGLTLFFLNWKTWTVKNLKEITLKEWFEMLGISVLAILSPTLIFIGLMRTQVINVVLLSTLDIPFALIFGWMISKDRPSLLSVIAALLALGGVSVIFLLHKPMMMPKEMGMTNLGLNPISNVLSSIPREGEIAVAIGIIIHSLTDEISRKYLAKIRPGIFSVFRSLVGVFVFFVVVLIMFGWGHFIDIFSPFLWEWMLFYGGIIIAGGIYLWFRSLPILKPADFSIGNACAPLAGILFAYLIVNEIPDQGQILGGIIILIGIFVGLYGQLRQVVPMKKIFGFSKIRSFTGI